MIGVLSANNTFLVFLLDDEPAGIMADSESPGVEAYNQTVYSRTNITSSGTGPYGAHNFTMVSRGGLMSFDFAKYTYVAFANLPY